jgi:uncharacterized protein with PQ loop repeat
VIEAIGTTAALALALCCIPQLIASWRQRSAAGLSWWFLGLWGAGEVGMLIYTAQYGDPILWLNYGGNALIVAALLLLRSRKL